MKHPRNVGWGEIGLDYHYDNSPRDIQQEVFTRQLRHAVRLGKPLTIHTREADDDTERILKAEVPKDHKVTTIHCLIYGFLIVKPTDPHSLLHRRPGLRAKAPRSFSKSLHWHYRSVKHKNPAFASI